MKKIVFFLFTIVIHSGFSQNLVLNHSVGSDSFLLKDKKITFYNSDVYDLTLKKELIIAAPIAVLLVTDYFTESKSITSEDLAQLNLNDVPWFERHIIYFDTTTAARAGELSDILNKSTLLLGITSIAIPIGDFQEILTNFILYYEGMSINSGLTDILKKTVGRVRPYAYNTTFSDTYRLHGAVTSSFPSGHSSSSAFSCFFAAKMIDDYLIDDNNRILKTINWTSAALIPAWVGYLRMAAGVHFLTDVAAGYLIGASCGFFIPAIHRINNENISITPAFGLEGNGISCTIKF